jgi:hypothetical protein
MKPSQNCTQNILLILGVIVLALLPLWIVENRPPDRTAKKSRSSAAPTTRPRT